MRLIDRLMILGLRLGIGSRGTALLETTGRRSGQKRVTPVTNGLDGDRFWIVTEHGMAANYVRNLLHDPHVRVRARGRWRAGSAHLVDEDPAERLEKIAERNPRARANTGIVRRSATDLRVIRIDLDELTRPLTRRRAPARRPRGRRRSRRATTGAGTARAAR